MAELGSTKIYGDLNVTGEVIVDGKEVLHSENLKDAPAATTSDGGILSSADKTKLNGIDAGANAYAHPASHTVSEVTGLQTALDGKEPANANIQTHVTSPHAPADAQKNSDITQAEIETKLVGEIESHSHVGLSGFTYRDVTTDTAAVISECLSVDTTVGPITLTFPVAPIDGDRIMVQDRNGTFDVNTCTVDNNGKKIQRVLGTMELDVKDINVLFVFNTSQDSWIANFYAGAIIPTSLDDFTDVSIVAPAANEVMVYNGSTWQNTPFGGAKGGGTNVVFYENDTNVTDDYSITSGKNAMSAGPITIASLVTVTVPTGSTWSIV